LAQGEDTVEYVLGTIAKRECHSATFEVTQQASSYRFQFSQGGCDSVMVVYGVSIGSGKPGVQVHTVGINGARFVDYASSSRFANQIGLLKPDLILIAMGTNETVYGLDASGLESAATRLVTALKASSPECSFLLVSPPDYQRKARRRVKSGRKWVTKTSFVSNQFSRQAGRVLAEVADQQDAAYFDLMKAMGGFGSMSTWARNGWAAYDHIHFSESGYSRIGRMISESILESYEVYKND
jgi:lysophospholipase L1-like esterase